jgi:hypothetical protein
MGFRVSASWDSMSARAVEREKERREEWERRGEERRGEGLVGGQLEKTRSRADTHR